MRTGRAGPGAPGMTRLAMAGLTMATLVLAGCVYDADSYPKYPRAPQQTSNRGIAPPGQRDKIPDTPYEVRKAEVERDRQIAGNTGPTYPPLFKNQKSDVERDGGS